MSVLPRCQRKAPNYDQDPSRLPIRASDAWLEGLPFRIQFTGYPIPARDRANHRLALKMNA
jgi:hypothetical protein